MCVYVSNLHYGDVSMQHSKGEGCPVSTIRMHRGVLWGAWWNLNARDKSVLQTKMKIILSSVEVYIPCSTLINVSICLNC